MLLPNEAEVSCPKCGALPGQPCRTKDGRPGRHAHNARISEWLTWLAQAGTKPVTITLTREGDVEKILGALRLRASMAESDAALNRWFPATAANYDDTAAAYRELATRITEQTEV